MEITTYKKKRITCTKKVSNENKIERFKTILKSYNDLNEYFFKKINGHLIDNVMKYIDCIYRENKHIKSQNKLISSGLIQFGSFEYNQYLFDILKDSINNKRYYAVKFDHILCKNTKKCFEQLVKYFVDREGIEMKLPNSIKFSVAGLDFCLKNKTSDKRKLIVIIFEEFEYFDSKVIDDLINNLTSLNTKFTFVFLMGLKSPFKLCSQTHQWKTISKLTFEYFHGQSSDIVLNDYIKTLMRTNLPFTIGAKIFDFLIKERYFINNSLTEFIKGYKFCLHEHVMSNNTKEYIPDKDTTAFTSYTTLFVLLIDWLSILTTDVIDISRQYCELLGTHLKSGLSRSCILKTIFNSVENSLNIDQICSKIKLANQHLISNQENSLAINNFIVETNILMDKLNKPHDNSQIQPTYIASTINCKDRKQLMAQLKLNIKTQTYIKPYQEFTNFIHNWLHENLPHYSNIISEFNQFVFDDLSLFKSAICPSPLETIQNALIKPNLYLKSGYLSNLSSTNINKHMPDTAILLKLILEFGTTVNLYDLLNQFTAIIEESDNDEIPGPMAQCRFTQSVAELEMMGFVKKKNDNYLSKLTFNGIC